MRRRWYPDEMERPAPAPVESLPLFEGAAAVDWPERPSADLGETGALPLEGTTEGRFQAWLATEDGQRFYAAFASEALGEVARGADRLSSKAITERVRSRLRMKVNNDWTCLLSRKCQAEHALTRGLFRDRLRVVP